MPGSPHALQALLDCIATLPLPDEAQRFFHGRGGCFPGCEDWTLDAFPPVWVLTCFGEASDELLATLHEALAQRWAQLAPDEPLNWVFQRRGQGQSDTRLMAGSVPEPHVVQEAGTRFRVQVLKGQNHGLFLDMAEGRRWVRDWAAAHPGQKVLNLFAYTCAFSVVARQAGARSVSNVDMSAAALTTGQQNHQLNGITDGAQFMAHDLFKSWGKLTRGGPYGLVIVDPPSYQKGSFVATNDYAKVMRRLPDLVRPGGHVLLCLNAPELPSSFLTEAMAELAPELVFEQRLPNPAVFADVSPERALKVLVYRQPELG